MAHGGLYLALDHLETGGQAAASLYCLFLRADRGCATPSDPRPDLPGAVLIYGNLDSGERRSPLRLAVTGEGRPMDGLSSSPTTG